MRNTVVFRADGNSTVGIGHIMRCLSIADSFKAKGQLVLFILADHNIEKLVNDRGYETQVLNSCYSDMEKEFPMWEGLPLWNERININIIVVDSYFVTHAYFSGLRKLMDVKGEGGLKIVYIDDLGQFSYPVDILINYNLYGPDIDYLSLYGSIAPRLILGHKYVPMRSMFRGVPPKKQKKIVKNIMISTGGADTFHLALSIIGNVIRRSNVENYNSPTYHFLIGYLNDDREEIHNLADGQANIVLHENVSDMKSLIYSMDICVSAAGSTLYEICACGVPLITYVIADNQIMGAEAFERYGLSYNIGDIRGMKNPEEVIISAIDDLAYQYENRVCIGRKMQEMIDGDGADRIVLDLVG